MAKKVTVTLIDDVDQESAADETVEFGIDGVTYEIDLSDDNAANLRAVGILGGARPAGRWAQACQVGSGCTGRPEERQERSIGSGVECRHSGMGPRERLCGLGAGTDLGGCRRGVQRSARLG